MFRSSENSTIVNVYLEKSSWWKQNQVLKCGRWRVTRRKDSTRIMPFIWRLIVLHELPNAFTHLILLVALHSWQNWAAIRQYWHKLFIWFTVMLACRQCLHSNWTSHSSSLEIVCLYQRMLSISAKYELVWETVCFRFRKIWSLSSFVYAKHSSPSEKYLV